jgi:hypothetical protein
MQSSLKTAAQPTSNGKRDKDLLLPKEITENVFENRTLNPEDIECLTQKFKNRQKIFGGYEVVLRETEGQISGVDRIVTGIKCVFHFYYSYAMCVAYL